MIKRPQLAAALLLLAAALCRGGPCGRPGQALHRMVRGRAQGLPVAAATGDAARRPYNRWFFREDFSHGIPGWLSFPLPQDVGYDPSLYTTEMGGSPVLVRDVTANGERLRRVGLLRELRFHATPSSSFRVVYDLAMSGRIVGAQLTLATVDGRRYAHPILVPSEDVGATRRVAPTEVRLNGRELQIPAAGAEVEAIVIEADVAAPVLGSHNRLTLRAFEVEAQRPPSVPIEAPKLEYSLVDDIAVAREVVKADSSLVVRLRPGQSGQLALYDGAGALAHTETIPPVAAVCDVSDRRYSAGLGNSKFENRNSITERVSSFDFRVSTPGLWRAKITSGPARTDFRFLVLGKVPAHPRVLLTAERLGELRSQSYSTELLAIVHRRAAELRAAIQNNPNAGENIARLSPVSVFPGLVEYFALMENYSHAIAFNALDSRIGDDQQAMHAARRALLAVAEWPTWTPAWFSAHGLHTYYEVGVFTQRVALGYDLIADQLASEEKSRIADAFWRNSIHPTLDEYFFFDRMPIAASNHMANSVGGAIAACVALYGDVPDWESRFEPALAELIATYERLLDGLFPGDGSEAEPAGYENFAAEGMSWGAAALHALNIRPRGADRMTQAFWWLRYAQFKPGKFLDTGDFQTGLSALSGYAWSAENAGDPALRAFYETATDRSLMGVFRLRHTGRALEEAPALLDLACCTHPSTPVPEPPPSRIFPLRGSAVMRSGWRPQDTVISLRIGPWWNHEHHDQGSFRVAAWGEELIAEAGYSDYYKDPRYADYFTQAPAHNTVVVDSDSFSQGDYDGRYWKAFQNYPKFTRHIFSRGLDYLSADLAPAYGGTLDRYTREYLFIKPDILIVRDLLRAASPHRYSWFLHIPLGAQTKIDAAQTMIRGKTAFAALTAGGRTNPWTLQQTPIPVIDYGDLDQNRVKLREAFRLESPEGNADFLVAMHFQKASEGAEPLHAFSTASGEGFTTGAPVAGLPERRRRSQRAATKTGGATQRVAPATILFRIGAGRETRRVDATTALSAGDITADGDVLAVSESDGTQQIFSADVHSLRRGQQLLFSSTAAIDAVLRESPSLAELQVLCPAETSLKIRAERQPAEVTLDQGRISAPVVAGFLSLAYLAKGEHVVRISY